MFGPDNPLPVPTPPLNGTEPPVPPAFVSDEDPPFTGWDVLQIAVLLVVSILVFLFVTAAVAHSLFYRRVPFVNVAQIPMLAVMAQLLAYLLVLAFMVSLVKREPGRSFWQAIRWNWPKNWFVFPFGGGVMALVLLQGVARFLPMPKDLPINHMFQHGFCALDGGTFLSRLPLSCAGKANGRGLVGVLDLPGIQPDPRSATGTRLGAGAGDFLGGAGADHHPRRHEIGCHFPTPTCWLQWCDFRFAPAIHGRLPPFGEAQPVKNVCSM